MRLAVFTNQFPAQVSTFFARDMRGLLHAGIEIDVFPIHPLDPALWRYVPDILNDDILPKSRIHHVSPVRFLPLTRPSCLSRLPRLLKDAGSIGLSAARFGIRPAAKSAYAFLKAWAAALQYSNDNYDHILSYWGSYAATYAYLFHRLTNPRIPFSMFLHAGDLYEDQVYLEEKLLYADNVFVVCEFNRQFIRLHYPSVFDAMSSRIHVYHPSLDLAEFPYEADAMRSRRILAVGRFDKCKGFDDLLRAVAHLKSQGMEAEVELVGDGDQMVALKALAGELGIEARVHFRGWLPFAEVRNAMNQAIMLVHPSSELGDAVPTVIKEASALGTPVIGTTVGGIPELLDHGRCGILVPPRDVTALGNAIRTLLTDSRARQTYAASARQFAEDTFDLWRNGERLANVLRSTSNRRG